MATKTATREIEGRDSVGLYLDEIARNDLLDAAKEVELDVPFDRIAVVLPEQQDHEACPAQPRKRLVQGRQMRGRTVVEIDGHQPQTPVLGGEAVAQSTTQRRELGKARSQENSTVVQSHEQLRQGR